MKKRILALFLVGIMVLLPLVGCNKKEAEIKTDEVVTRDEGVIGDDGLRYDSEGYLMDDLPDDLKFDDVEIEFLHWTEAEIGEFDAKEDTPFAVDRQLYMRDRAVQSRLGVSFKWIGTKGHWNSLDNFLSTAQTAMNTGDRYDIIATYSQTAGVLAFNGLTAEVQNNKYLDLSKPWWPDSLTESFTVGGKLYFVSGDLSSTFLAQMIGVFYNKEYFPDENLYQLVYDGEWTLDTMFTLAKDQYLDVDQSYSKTQNDKYGIVVPWLVYTDGFFYGCNLITVDRDTEGDLRVSNSYIGERADTMTEMLQTFFHETDDGWLTQTSDTVGLFARGNAAFMVSPGVQALTSTALQDSDIDYGVLPMPKYNSQQQSYKTVVTNLFTLYSIFAGSTQDEIDRAGAVLECMGSEAHRGLAPTLFNECLKLRYAKDGDTGKMYDIIRDGVVFDVGRVYAVSLDGITQDAWQKTVINNDGVWGAKAGGVDAQLQALLDKLQDSFDAR